MRVFKDGAWWISGYKAILIQTESSTLASDGKWSMMEDSWPLPTLKRYSTYGLKMGLANNFTFFVRVKTRIWRHKIECEKAAKMIATQKPLDTTSGQCWKSPPKSGWVCNQTTSNRDRIHHLYHIEWESFMASPEIRTPIGSFPLVISLPLVLARGSQGTNGLLTHSQVPS
jgi:hypothetical protein